ncbi:MAG: DUF2163 domain-containing protein [Candidatus Adiutrix sp.]|jgi:uncharacterized phage protein (TIGR02218 family)|nr:DUF2163 domain-containing protein [Candidatus Adiutrix sp.]
MRDFSPAMLEALDDTLIVMGTHTVVTRRDGLALRFVDLDEPSIIGGQAYYPNGSAERSAVRLNAGLGADSTELRGILGADSFSRQDLLAGLFDYADLEVFLSFIGRPDLPVIPLLRGRFGEVEVDSGQYTIQVNSLTHAFSHNIGVRTSPTCRNRLGDENCRVTLEPYRVYGTITAIVDARTFEINALSGQGHLYQGGELQVAGGAAAGLASEIRHGSGSAITLYVPLTVTPAVGDAVCLAPGCDRSRSACRDAFGNLVNFNGEPDLPGQDVMLAPGVSANG